MNILAKIAIVVLVLYFVYKKLHNNSSLKPFKDLINDLNGWNRVLILSGMLILMLVNWLLECAKWQYLCQKVEHLSFWKSIQSVFCGLSMAIFTPNRLGEYGGRVMFLSPRKRIFGVVAMGVGALAQFVVTNFLGAIACAWFLIANLGAKGWIALLVALASSLAAAFFPLLYFHVRLIEKYLQRFPFMKKINRFLTLLERYSKRELATVLLYSVCRYVVFSSQYFILFMVLIPDINKLYVLTTIFLLFFIQSALPSLDLLDVGVRSLTASYIFGFITDQEVTVMAIVAFIWFVNLILPAILGAGFVFKINFFASTNR
ncbi:lysylphosphatidylglycerol synthase domain-containing protein [Olivibacter sitiensis]|uniref:lysylphosphatidylglycerol synthase domain-containing protein n=1 Tax=Olivibacter sitiensis TaxID=376470 RepID=UPI001FDFE073|nr:lysylphosphatidylglycerol synthase domain-containing protein [Olivibacter sitiensis]